MRFNNIERNIGNIMAALSSPCFVNELISVHSHQPSLGHSGSRPVPTIFELRLDFNGFWLFRRGLSLTTPPRGCPRQ